MDRTIRDELNARIIKHYAVEGKACALGWTAFQAGLKASGKEFISEEEYQRVRDAFYMGMQHCYSSLMQTLGEEGSEADDFAVMASFTQELNQFLVEDFLVRHPIFAKASNVAMGTDDKSGSVQSNAKKSSEPYKNEAQRDIPHPDD